MLHHPMPPHRPVSAEASTKSTIQQQASQLRLFTGPNSSQTPWSNSVDQFRPHLWSASQSSRISIALQRSTSSGKLHWQDPAGTPIRQLHWMKVQRTSPPGMTRTRQGLLHTVDSRSRTAFSKASDSSCIRRCFRQAQCLRTLHWGSCTRLVLRPLQPTAFDEAADSQAAFDEAPASAESLQTRPPAADCKCSCDQSARPPWPRPVRPTYHLLKAPEARPPWPRPVRSRAPVCPRFPLPGP